MNGKGRLWPSRTVERRSSFWISRKGYESRGFGQRPDGRGSRQYQQFVQGATVVLGRHQRHLGGRRGGFGRRRRRHQVHVRGPNLAHSIFKQINLRFNGALMSEQTDTCAYSAFFQTLPNCSGDDWDTLLQPQGWINYLDVTPTLASTSWTTNARRFFLVVYYIFY